MARTKFRSRARKGIGTSCLGARRKSAEKEYNIIYRSGLTLAEEGDREKDAKIERSMFRGIVGDPRAAEFGPPMNDRRGVVGGVDCEDELEPSPAGSSTFHGSR